MITKAQILNIIETKLEQDGVFIVELKVSVNNEIQLLIDSLNGVNISYCVDVSRLIEHTLDREEEDFELEVSSPGIGPFKVWDQFQKYEGKEILVKSADAKPQKGVLTDLSTTSFKIVFKVKEKLEGKKKKVEVEKEITYNIGDIISAEPVIKF